VLNVVSDERYQAFYDSLGLAQASSRSYPAGFAEALTDEFLEREFEVRVGEVDQNMRIAISLEREIGAVLERSQSNNARWFGLMASPPLRAAFEAALNLPTSIGSLDLQQQLTVFTERAESLFGTSDLGDLGRGDLLDDLQQRYLRGLEIQGIGQTPSGGNEPYSSALAILRGG